MKKLIILLLFVVTSSCSKEVHESDVQSVRLFGRYNVESENTTWIWKFVQTSTCGGELHTFAEDTNNCGLYFYGQCSDTLICAAGNLHPKVYRGNTWMRNDTVYYESEQGLLKLYK